MYSESDLDAAVAAGAISAEAADGLRRYMAARRQAPAADEEHFRLVTGFNDIFVTIASIILLSAVWWFASELHAAAGSAATAVTAWGLAEYFTLKRRMALPSILFLITYVCGLFYATRHLMEPGWGGFREGGTGADYLMPIAVASTVTVVGAWLHWRRFHVPITVAAGVGALVAALVSLVFALVPGAESATGPIIAVAGLGVFAVAMAWDMSDRTRRTRRSDVAFWLHLGAAPLIVHPVFNMLGLLGDQSGPPQAMIAVGLYVLLALVALAIDRRALLVSSLFYVLYAMSSLMKAFSTTSGFALTALIIGAGLLLLSALWHAARNAVVRQLPAGLQARLPATGVQPPPLPAV